MKTNYKPFARKFRQFKNQAKQIKRLHSDGSFASLSESKQREMFGRLKKLYAQLRGRLQHWRLKKTLAGLSFLLLGASSMNAQTFGTPELNPFDITPSGYNLISVADIDDDGDTDLFLVGYDYDTEEPVLSFLENIGTASSPAFADPVESPFGLQTNNTFITTTYFSDIDNDGDMDLFAGTYAGYDADLIFFENTGTPTNPAFAGAESNPFGFQPADGFTIPSFADIDGDGDQDLFIGEVDGAIKYYENEGTATNPAFASPVAAPFDIPTPPGYISLLEFADIDNDGDLDLMAGTTYDEYSYLASFFYAENTGTPAAPVFEEYIQDPFNLTQFESYISQPVLTDIDDDGDLDLFSTAFEYGVAFFENLGSVPTSADAMVETFVNTPFTFAESDFSFSDQDGDDFKSIKITSLTSVGTLQLNGVDVSNDLVVDITDLPLLVFTPLMDEEGNPYDAFSFQVGDENDVFSVDHVMTISVGGVNTKDNLLQASLDISPNPTTDLIQLNLESVNALNNVTIKLIDQNGRLITQQSATVAGNVLQQQFDVSKIAAGAYFIQIDSDGKTVSTQFIKK